MNLHRLDLVSLSLYTRVVRTGSISGGAELSHLAVGAASKRMSDLEAAVGAPLLERHSRGVTLTPAGEALHRHAQRILGDVDQLAADLSDHARGVVGVVRLWANTSAITQFLPAELAAFARAEPQIRIELNEADSHEVVLAVAEGRADAGIFAERTPALGLYTLAFRSDKLVLVVPAGHPLESRVPVALADAMDYDFVSLTGKTSLAQRVELEGRHTGKTLRIRIRVRSFDAMCQMVAAGLGIAVLPEGAVQPMLEPLGLRRIEIGEPWVHRELILGVRDAAAVAKPVRKLVDHLRRP